MKKFTLLLMMLLCMTGAKADDIYSTEHSVGSWKALQLSIANYPDLGKAKAGDVLAINVKSLDGEDTHTITIQDANWAQLDVKENISETGTYYFILSSDVAAKISGGGVMVTGQNYTLDKVKLLYKTTLWSGSLNDTSSWGQSDALDKSLFSNLSEGSLMSITVSAINTADWHNALLRVNYETNVLEFTDVSVAGTYLKAMTQDDVTALKNVEYAVNLVARYLCISELNEYRETTVEEQNGAAYYSVINRTMNSLWPKDGEDGVTTGTSVSDKTITMGKYTSSDSWPGAGWWLESSGSYFDASDYDKVVVRFSSATAAQGGINIKYKDTVGDSQSVWYAFTAGTTEVVCDLDDTRKANLAEITIQGPQKAVYNLADVYFASSNYYALNEAATSTITAVNDAYVALTRSFVAGWNSLCLPFATTASALGCKAYAFTSATSNSVTFTEVTDLSAATPYLVKFDEAVSSKAFADVDVVATAAGSVEQNGVTFTGTYAKVDGVGKFGVVTNGDIKQGVAGSKFNGYRAYFEGLTASSARVFVLDEETTGIAQMKEVKGDDNKFYNLAGQRVENPTKGLYIVNGKKVFIK